MHQYKLTQEVKTDKTKRKQRNRLAGAFNIPLSTTDSPVDNTIRNYTEQLSDTVNSRVLMDAYRRTAQDTSFF